MGPELHVPTVYREALQELARLEPEQADRLISAVGALGALEPVSVIQQAARTGSPPGLGDAADRIVASLLSLQSEMRGDPADELADSLSAFPTLQLDSEERAHLRDRVAALLSSTAISTTATGLDLLTQHERNYRSAHIFTDIRPLFGADLEQEPGSAVIVEVLQLETWSRDGGRETLHVAMDEEDLNGLAGVVDRALKKTATVKRMLHKQQITTFDQVAGD